MADTLPVTSAVDHLIVRGSAVSGDLAEALTECTASVGIDQIGEITMSFYDRNFELLRSGVFAKQGEVNFMSFRQEVTSVDTEAAPDGFGQTTIRARAAVVGMLKRRFGPFVMRASSPSDFVIHECKAVGAQYVVQPSPKRKHVARDRKPSTDGASPSGDTRPSSWSTFERLAKELGFVVFESGGVIYFGKPSWLRKRITRISVVTWNTGDETTDCLTVPTFSDNSDATQPIQATIDVPRERVSEFMPGYRVRVVFPPFGDDTYLVTHLEFPIAGYGPASVTVGKPTDPKPEPPHRKGGGGGGGTGKQTGSISATSYATSGSYTKSRRLGDLLYEAGFRGLALQIATGVAVAESGHMQSGRWVVDAHAIGDIALQDSKWGPSIGVFQIRSLNNPFMYSGVDGKRIRSKLTDAVYNARLAKQISADGGNWWAWSTFTSGAYRQHMGRQDALVLNWGGISTYEGSSAPTSTGVTGRQSAADFVMLALKQVGDHYVWGAAPSGPNPSAFDCSSLVQWAAGRVGCYMPRTSETQMGYMRSKGTTLPVSTAIRTRGALLWKPGHIAISLGDGRTVEALNPSYGVTTMSATDRSFSWQGAGKIPGMRY